MNVLFRYLDLRVGYYPESEHLFWINHDVIQWIPLEIVLNDIRAFAYISPDPIIIDVHRTPVGFDYEEAPELFVSLVNATLGEYLAPADLGRNVTPGDLWTMGKTIMFSYGSRSLRKTVPWLWPPIYQAWANTPVLKSLLDFLDHEMVNVPKLEKVWAGMAHLTPTMWDIFLKPDTGVR